MNNKPSSSGFTLIEVIVASAIFAVLAVVIAQLFNSFSRSLVTNLNHTRSLRLGEDLKTSIDSIDFKDIFACDSSLRDFGLRKSDATGVGVHSDYYGSNTSYPTGDTTNLNNYKGRFHLTSMRNAVTKAGFKHFDLKVNFLLRISTNPASPDTRPFEDVNGSTTNINIQYYTTGDGIDDSDSYIRYQDINNDGDFFDVFDVWEKNPPPSSTTTGMKNIYLPTLFAKTGSSTPGTGWVRPRNFPKTISEMPDTRLKEVTLRVFNKKNEVVLNETWIVTQSGLSGSYVEDWESDARLEVGTPKTPFIAFSETTPEQSNSRSLLIQKVYPSTPNVERVDNTSHPLRISGIGLPNATVNVSNSILGSPSLFSNTTSLSGEFDFSLDLYTTWMTEGKNILTTKLTKGSFSSPLWTTSFIYDKRPPVFGNKWPTDGTTVRTRSPFVAIEFDDDKPLNVEVSGIEKSVINMSTGTSMSDYAEFLYDDKWKVYKDTWVVLASTHGLPNALPDGTITVTVEGGDKAQYKTNASWSFNVAIDATDTSSPTIKNASGGTENSCQVTAGLKPTITCFVEDPESGIDWRTFYFRVYENPVTPNYDYRVQISSTPRMGDFLDPKVTPDGYVFSATLTDPLTSGGWYCLRMRVSNYMGLERDETCFQSINP